MAFSRFVIPTLISIVLAATVPPLGAIVVGTGRAFHKIQDAVNAAAVGQKIFIEPGVYREKVIVPEHKSGITIIGSSSAPTRYQENKVTIISDDEQDTPNVVQNGQFGTLVAQGDDFRLYNVNVVRRRGPWPQSVTIGAYGTRQGYYACSFEGYTNTVLSAKGHHIFVSCFIEGTTHFITSQKGRAWFEQCYIRARLAGYITANGRDSASNPSIFVLNRSTIAGPTSLARKVYLGRAWEGYSHVIIQNCILGDVIKKQGWQHNSNPRPSPPRVTFSEFGNRGPGAEGPRVNITTPLDAPILKERIFGFIHWIDTNFMGSVRQTVPMHPLTR